MRKDKQKVLDEVWDDDRVKSFLARQHPAKPPFSCRAMAISTCCAMPINPCGLATSRASSASMRTKGAMYTPRTGKVARWRT